MVDSCVIDVSGSLQKTIDSYDIQIRHGFVRKVLGIVLCQLMMTFGFVLFCATHPKVKTYIENNRWSFIVGTVFMFVILFMMFCFARKYPWNYILLFLFTACVSLVLSPIALIYDTNTILIAIGITTLQVFILILFAIQTKHDFTSLGPYLLVVLCTMTLYLFAALIFGFTPGIFYSYIATVLFSCYIVYDMQLIVGGDKHRFNFDVDDYVLAAVALYLDIINLFLQIIEIINRE
jgi:FtsH-binding integral membrane protein